MRKRTRRKVYPLINTVNFAIEGATIAPQDKLDKLRIAELSALECFTTGTATQQEFYDIRAMVAICEAMAGRNIGAEAKPACQRASASLDVDEARFNTTGVMGTTGPGLQAYRDVFEYHDLQRQSVARSVYEACILEALNKVKFAKKEN